VVSRKTKRRQVGPSLPNSITWTPTQQVPTVRELRPTRTNTSCTTVRIPLTIEVTPEPKIESHGGRLKEGMAGATQVPSGGRSRAYGTSRTDHFNLGE